jgi:alginate O-acetyltransferase complex protein AlgI
LKRLFQWLPIAWLLTMTVVFVAWIFFRATNVGDAMMMIERIVVPASDWTQTKLAPLFFELLILYLPLQWFVHRTTYQRDITNAIPWQAALGFASLVLFSYIYYVDGNDFIYFQF